MPLSLQSLARTFVFFVFGLAVLVAGASSQATDTAHEWVSLGALVTDEGTAIPAPATYCPEDCCRKRCDAEPKCNSISTFKGACFLKEKCVTADSPVKKGPPYTTHYRTGPCPRPGAVEAAAKATKEQADLKASRKKPYTYARPAPFPPAAGTPLPKMYSMPKSDAPWAEMPKEIYDDHCKFLIDSKIEWIVLLGDSVARAFGVAMMEHLAGDDVHFCDAKNGPPQVLGAKKYLNEKK